jgi:DNA-directed RNA polymerase specialized sigma24 family protein
VNQRKYLKFKLRKKVDEPHLQKLPLLQSEPIRLIHCGGMSYEAAAAQLNIPINTLKTRVHRGRASIIAMRAAAEQPETTDA